MKFKDLFQKLKGTNYCWFPFFEFMIKMKPAAVCIFCKFGQNYLRMTATQSLNLYNIALRYFKNEADASAFVKEIEVVVDNKFDGKKDILATKDDIMHVRLEIRESKTDMIKWFVAFFITLALMIVGLYLKK